MPDESYRNIPLFCKGEIVAHTKVSPDDYEWLLRWRWRLNSKYAIRTEYIDKKCHVVSMHRAVLGLSRDDKRQGDHINGDKLDNRRDNLRAVTKTENAQNETRLRSNNTSGYRGVVWDPTRNKWRAQAKYQGREVNIGRFIRIEDAARAVADFRLRHMPGATS